LIKGQFLVLKRPVN